MKIIDFYLSKVSVADEIDTDLLAKATMGMTGEFIKEKYQFFYTK